jgi:VWFA-related protein
MFKSIPSAIAAASICVVSSLLCMNQSWAQVSVQENSLAKSGAQTDFHITSRLVVLDVVVTDRKGNVVDRPLIREDFTVVENKQIQTIRNFEPPSAHSRHSTGSVIVHSAADLAKIGDSPVTILVLDELNSRFEDMSYSRQMMVKYLQSQPPVLKQPAVLMVATNATFQQLQDYTQDRDALIAIIKNHMPEFPRKLGNTGPGAVERVAQTLAALQQLAEASMGTPGRKSVIWVGNGFPSVDLVALDSAEVEKVEAAFRRITIRLLAARITMYTINPTPNGNATVSMETPDGLASAIDAAGESPFDKGAVSFADLAPLTGGIAYSGRNDLSHIIGDGIDKGLNYYTITYTPTSASEDQAAYRNIRVVMNDPNLVATTSRGYFPETDADLNPVLEKAMKEKQIVANLKLDISAALTTTIFYNGLEVSAVRSTPGTFLIHVGAKGIGWLDSSAGQHEEATVAAAWYDSRGKLISHVAAEEIFERRLDSEGAAFSLHFSLPIGVARLRFVVRDASNGRMGTFDMTKF